MDLLNKPITARTDIGTAAIMDTAGAMDIAGAITTTVGITIATTAETRVISSIRTAKENRP
jgi:nitrous oxide reductase